MAQIVARIVDVLPLKSRVDATNYMGPAANAIHTRPHGLIWRILDARYGRADADRSFSWLTSLTDFRRDRRGAIKISGCDSPGVSPRFMLLMRR